MDCNRPATTTGCFSVISVPSNAGSSCLSSPWVSTALPWANSRKSTRNMVSEAKPLWDLRQRRLRSTRREEKRHLPRGVFRRVRGVNRIALLGLRVQASNRARLGLRRIRGPDDLAEMRDCIVTFQHQGERRSGRHERDERPEERALPMDLVERFRPPLRQAHHLGLANVKAFRLEVEGFHIREAQMVRL